MPHSLSVDAIVLRVHDVGEADRFCILLTREHGRLAARARGVRKPKSRMGGSLLPFATIRAELREESAGYLITSAACYVDRRGTMEEFLRAGQAVELMLLLLQDAEPMPDMYELLSTFLADPRATVDAFIVRLLHAQGLFPESTNVLLAALPPSDRLLLDACVRKQRMDVTFTPRGSQALHRLSDTLIEEQSSRKPRASAWAQMLQES